ncbi:3-hydroxyacyl-CoA dehydrogenase family protein [Achromobacter insolitus]|uniref:Putative 3-hydroxybutyryl-CoA dehydrogenase n=1 Tax=Achromobacter insolitus TaxID=217204 RepID=A0A6S7F000_9BURK|nr:3-hydroxyacyl-CoA dehydrogenase NAD-binding domain-containing protein [Achromobacter insolitus]APX73762.1 3-hydroxyacyl-CoA dehydrogenase [Achromobacter insolitus]OWT54615.1 3-hydroxyacyl-CoA dehydrogenase [Achromobacter insolitus]CAB3732734.1 putative 3-hydroxybutyryl-CoA dehydrogenase [Achromobacter insolitus]CAB3931039.1 putative 3-hydroxybutyryl-CoA dehydrogenase [Achromobacter insolitus]CAB3947186.1 putative 3-hydroxybutyryl-CoA dehydrogenase [Achromobacter insolitus]
MDQAIVLGAGTMGADVAAGFHAAGWRVWLVEPDAAARAAATRRVNASSEMIGGQADAGRIVTSATMEEIDWSDTRIVVECVPELLETKREVFARLERLAPASIPLTSNSSSFPISAIGEGLHTRSRMVGLHYFMPAHLVPAVEVIRGEATDEAMAQEVSRIMRDTGKKPVQVKRDVPGFLANRIQHALMREAIALVEEGFASAEDVDTAVRYGFGFRYIAAGPLLQKDLAGIDIHCAAAATMYPHLRTDDRPSPLMRELVEQGNIGVKSPSLRGFYQWTPDRVAKEQRRYQVALGKAMQILKDEEALA